MQRRQSHEADIDLKVIGNKRLPATYSKSIFPVSSLRGSTTAVAIMRLSSFTSAVLFGLLCPPNTYI